MYTLKIVEKANSLPSETEVERYIELGSSADITFLSTNQDPSMPVARVEGSDSATFSVFVYCDQSAYLINEHGKTLKVIHRPLSKNNS